MTLTAEHAARLREVRRSRAEGKPVTRPVVLNTDFGYVVIMGSHRIGGPFWHRWEAERRAADTEGAVVRRVAVV